MNRRSNCCFRFATRISIFFTCAFRSNTASSRPRTDNAQPRPAMIEIDIPGGKLLRLSTAIFYFNGTLARDGRLCDGVADRLRTLAQRLAIQVATADTTRTARTALADLPVDVHIMPETGQLSAKRAFLETCGADRTVAVGNGR